MRVWITGGNGMVGQALQEALLQRGIPFLASRREDADISDPLSLKRFYLAQGPFTHLINAAAYTKVDQAEIEPHAAWKSNAEALHWLGNLAREEGLRLLHLSTDYVFDGKKQIPYIETDVHAPNTVYGKTKSEGEARLLSTLPSACIVRTSWVFGKTGHHFVNTMLNLMRQKETLHIVSDQRGRPTYASDLAEALIDALDWQGIFHLANSNETSWHQFALAIQSQAKRLGIPLACHTLEPITTEAFGALAPRPSYSVLDTSKTDRLRKAPLRPWQEALQEALSFYA